METLAEFPCELLLYQLLTSDVNVLLWLFHQLFAFLGKLCFSCLSFLVQDIFHRPSSSHVLGLSSNLWLERDCVTALVPL